MLRELTRGSKGEDVRALQQGLNQYFGGRRDTLNPDGDFGSRTLAAVEAFQIENPGTGKRAGGPDGIVGNRTWRRLFPLVTFQMTMVVLKLRMPAFGPRGIRPPNLGPGPLRLPGEQPSGPRLNPSPFPPVFDWSKVPRMADAHFNFTPLKVPALSLTLPAPPPRIVPNALLQPPDPISPPPLVLPSLTMPIHKMEVAAGAVVNIGEPGDSNISLSISGAYLMGKESGAHAEFSSGIEVGSPGVDGSSGVTVAWFAQFAGIDLFARRGAWHLVQPYAQLSVENTQHGPKLGASLTPLNVSVDINDNVSVNWETGVAFEYFANRNTGAVGVESSLGLSISWDPRPPKRQR